MNKHRTSLLKKFKISELCELTKGSYPTLRTQPGEFPLVVTADFRRSADGWDIVGPAVCVPLISSTGHGDAALSRVHYQDGKFALANLLVALTPKQGAPLIAKYLYYLLGYQKDKLLVPLMMGTANVSLKPKDIAAVEIEVPSIEVQQRIVARIDTVQKQLQEAERLRLAIEDQLHSLFLSLHNDSGTTCRLGDLIELYEDRERIQPSESYPQVGVRGFGGGLFPKAAVNGTETTYKVFNRLYEDAIVLSQVKGWEGAIAVCPKSLSGMFVSPEYRTFRCKPKKATPRYMQEVVLSQWFWKYLQEATRGVGARRERVRPEKFLTIELHMPSFARQEIIVSMLTQLQIARQLRKETQLRSDALLPSLLQSELSQTNAVELH